MVYNDPKISAKVLEAQRKVVGEENIAPIAVRLGAEDFAFYGEKAPAAFFRLGILNEARGCVSPAHNGDFRVDDEVLHLGVEVFVQFILDNMNCI